jgi:hypothetical protein
MDTKRLVGMVMLFGACLFGILLSTAFFSTQDTDEIPYWLKGLRATGRVLEMSKDRIRIKVDTEKEMTFQTDAYTRISLLGNPQLPIGALVKITYKSFTDPNTPPLARWIKQLSETGETKHANPGLSPSPAATPDTTPSPAASFDATPSPVATPDAATSPGPATTAPPEKKTGTGSPSGI